MMFTKPKMVITAPSVRPTFMVSSLRILPTVTPPAKEAIACDTITQMSPAVDRLLTSSIAPAMDGLKTSRFPKNLAEANVPAVLSTNATDNPAITARGFFMIKE